MREHDGSAQPEPVDEVIGALVKRLQAMPVSDPRRRAAILARVRGRRQAPWRATLAWAWQPSVPMLAAATLAVAAIGIGYAGRVLIEPTPAAVATSDVSTAAAAPVIPVSYDANAIRRVPTQFVLAKRGANRVTLVGDFNGWGTTSIELKDLSNSGVWEVTVPLAPGRHTYAYLVNDSLWTLDTRAAQTKDLDYGRVSSVILVSDR